MARWRPVLQRVPTDRTRVGSLESGSDLFPFDEILARRMRLATRDEDRTRAKAGPTANELTGSSTQKTLIPSKNYGVEGCLFISHFERTPPTL